MTVCQGPLITQIASWHTFTHCIYIYIHIVSWPAPTFKTSGLTCIKRKSLDNQDRVHFLKVCFVSESAFMVFTRGETGKGQDMCLCQEMRERVVLRLNFSI